MTEVEVANSALVKLGAQPILSLDDAVPTARLCKLRITLVRDIVLRSYPWSAAIKRISLSPLVEEPAFDFSYQFQLPADFLHLVYLDTDEYQIEGTYILANVNAISIRYTARTDVSVLDPMCCEAIACYLAWELAYPIMQSNELRNSLWNGYIFAVKQAKHRNAIEKPQCVVEANALVEEHVG